MFLELLIFVSEKILTIYCCDKPYEQQLSQQTYEHRMS